MEVKGMYKGLRKVISVTLIMISLLTLFGPVAFANETSTEAASQEILKKVDKTNEYVYKSIEKAVKQAEKQVLKENKSDNLDEIIDKIIENLLEKTEEKVEKLIEAAAAEGVEVSKFYIEVTIYDRTILVDPCYAH
jgi:translation initiation factor 2 alpha subunit (eIF-2alpha)